MFSVAVVNNEPWYNAHVFWSLYDTECDLQDDITRKGVVFNEMKGVYSSPDSVNQRAVQHSLFPDNTYGEDSGGDPKVIPELTFEEFKVPPPHSQPVMHCNTAS